MLDRLTTVIVTFSVLLLPGCGKRPEHVTAPNFAASSVAKGAMSEYDKNGDGEINKDELKSLPSFQESVEQIDHNGDGVISRNEIENRIKEWEDTDVGRVNMTCKVMRHGQPLEGATVKLVPEKFLGRAGQTATGVTLKDGTASLSVPVPGNTLRGVAPGWYRVEITKEGEDIPPAYNTATTLGIEIAPDNEEMGDSMPLFEIE